MKIIKILLLALLLSTQFTLVSLAQNEESSSSETKDETAVAEEKTDTGSGASAETIKTKRKIKKPQVEETVVDNAEEQNPEEAGVTGENVETPLMASQGNDVSKTEESVAGLLAEKKPILANNTMYFIIGGAIAVVLAVLGVVFVRIRKKKQLGSIEEISLTTENLTKDINEITQTKEDQPMPNPTENKSSFEINLSSPEAPATPAPAKESITLGSLGTTPVSEMPATTPPAPMPSSPDQGQVKADNPRQ